MSSVKKGMVAGALSLGLAGLIAKVLGVVYQVPFQNWAGNTTIGLYQMAYTIYVNMLYVTTAGIPLAMSKMISERLTNRDYAGADRLYRVGARYLTIAGLITFVLTFATADLVAWLMGDARASTSIRALSFSLLIVPLLAAMRGYVQGHQEMAVSGNSQVVEQLLRSLFILTGVYIATRIGAAERNVAAVATFSALIGAGASLIYVARHVVAIRREDRKKFRNPSTEDPKTVFRRIMKYAVPITLTSLVLPLSQAVDSFSVTNLLKWGFDMTSDQASAQFGILTGQALKLVALPLALSTAVGLSLMPAITEAVVQRNAKLTHDRINTAFRLTSFFAFPTAIGIYVLARAVEIALFEKPEGVSTIAIVGLMAIFSSFELVTTYILQALGYMYQPVRAMFIGLAVKAVLNVVLVPTYGIFGAGMASVIGYLASSTINFFAVRKLANVSLSFRDLFVKPLIASVIMGGVVWMLNWLPFEALIPWPRIANLLLVLIGGGVGAVIFFGLMIAFKGVTREEMKRMPGIKRFVR